VRTDACLPSLSFAPGLPQCHDDTPYQEHHPAEGDRDCLADIAEYRPHDADDDYEPHCYNHHSSLLVLHALPPVLGLVFPR
jgi:hypothetical protein